MTTRTDTNQDGPATRRHPARRWLLALLAVAVAAAVALWPRAKDPGPPEGPQRLGDPALAAARAQAALRPCPAPGPGDQGTAAMRGVRAVCLGDGETIDLGAALAGRPALINVWASWCEVCREELPVLDAYAGSPDAVPVLGVQVLSDPADGLGLLASLGVHFPSVVDSDGAVTRALRAPTYLPVSYVVTRDGTIRQVLPPTPFTAPDQVDRAVRAISAETTGSVGP